MFGFSTKPIWKIVSNIIQPILDKDVSLPAKLQVNGRITEQGTFAEIYIFENENRQIIPSGSEYTKIEQFTADGLSSNAISDFRNHRINLTKVGKYKVSGTFSMFSDTDKVTFDIAGFLNRHIQPQLHLKLLMQTSSFPHNAMFSGFIDVEEENSMLDVEVKTDCSTDVGLTIEYGNLNVEYIGEGDK